MGREPDRRAPEPLLYRGDQLLGRSRIHLRRRSDKVRFVAHVAGAAGLLGLTAWWVIPLHDFAGPVLVPLTATHGVHVGDLPSLVFLAVAARLSVIAVRLLR